MKSINGLILAFVLSTVVFACISWWSLFHMATLYDRIHALESSSSKMKDSRNETQESLAKTKSDHFRNFTADEANEWLQYYEDTPENRKKWADAGTPMMKSKNNNKVWKRVREPIQLEGSIDDGYELVDE